MNVRDLFKIQIDRNPNILFFFMKNDQDKLEVFQMFPSYNFDDFVPDENYEEVNQRIIDGTAGVRTTPYLKRIS